MPKMRIYKGGMAYFPRELKEEGYDGDLTLTPDACVILIEKPKAKTRDIIRSLEILKAHYKHLANLEEQEGS